LEIVSFNVLDSTQHYLIKALQDGRLNAPIVVIAKEQTAGVGSRNNHWEGGEGNLFFSFAINLEDLPSDLPLSSASIYFSYIMKELLSDYCEDIWLKWPNDLYQKSSKVGGTITKKMDNILVCGMGVNLQKNSNGFKALNLNVEPILLLKEYLKRLKNYPSWKQIFSLYRIEFERNKGFSTHVDGELKSLENAILSEDGSLIIENKRVYSIR